MFLVPELLGQKPERKLDTRVSGALNLIIVYVAIHHMCVAV